MGINKKSDEILGYLKRRKTWEQNEHLLDVIISLMYEDSDNTRASAGIYRREFKLGKLNVSIDFRETN